MALADPGRTYVVYLPRGGEVSVDLSAVRGRCTGRWFNPRRGRTESSFIADGGRTWRGSALNAEDWVLRIDAEADSSGEERADV